MWQIPCNSAFPAGRFHLQRRVHAGEQRRPPERGRAVLGPVPARSATAGTGTPGDPGSTASQFEIASDGDYRQTPHGLFVQDDWRVSRRLTLNLGLRVEVEEPLREAENRNLGGFDAWPAP